MQTQSNALEKARDRVLVWEGFFAGRYQCRLYVTLDSGASFFEFPQLSAKNPYVEIDISIGKGRSWRSMLESLLHELVEGALEHVGATFYKESFGVKQNSDSRSFHFNHELFTQAMAIVADVLFVAEPALHEFFDKFNESPSVRRSKKEKK